jgi:anthranilate synthase component I
VSISPSLAEISADLSAGKPVAIWLQLLADLESPVAMMLKLKQQEPCSFLLESVLGGEQRGRYSILALDPDLIWRCRKDQAEISNGSLHDKDFTPCAEPSLLSLRRLVQESRFELPKALPPMAAGLLGYLGYGMVAQMEQVPQDKPDPIGIPDACFMRPQITVIHDSVGDKITITATIWQLAPGQPPENAYEQAQKRIRDIQKKLNNALPAVSICVENPEKGEIQSFASNISPESYYRAVLKTQEYIRAGEIFQAVLAQRFSAPFTLPSFALYRALRHLNPSPFLFYLDFGSFSLVGSSPEILVRLRGGTVTIRPIAGTRKRGATPQEDETLGEELLADPKEIAEHLMLLDLGRNDVGRVTRGGSVRVTERMILERYSHVMHIVSNVEGKLREDLDALDALMAGFPAGTVSGAPKIRAMEIIDELEPEARSFYAGCVGYFSADGSMDSCITLRTALVKDGMLYAQAGGGVVLDSTPEGEYEESCNKAKAVMKAAEIAHWFV